MIFIAILCYLVWLAALIAGCAGFWWVHLFFFAGVFSAALGLRKGWYTR